MSKRLLFYLKILRSAQTVSDKSTTTRKRLTDTRKEIFQLINTRKQAKTGLQTHVEFGK